MSKALLLFLLLLVVHSSTKAQRVKCNWPAGLIDFSLLANIENHYLGTLSQGMFLSTDKGGSWDEINIVK